MATADLTEPDATGPVIEPACPLPVDLAAHGYVQEELFAAGHCARYRAGGPPPSDGRWSAEVVDRAPYRTRLVVRGPVDQRRFSGTVLVEWLNVSGGIEAAPDWSNLHQEILRRGHAYVAVSAQAFGVHGGKALLGVPLARSVKGLVEAGAARYESLAHPGDAYAFDLFAQIGRSLRQGPGSAALGGLRPERVIAMGQSQSAFFLTTYVDAVHHHDPVFDGFLVHSRGGAAASLSGEPTGTAVSTGLQIRSDVEVPVLILQTETEVGPLLDYGPARQEDSDHVRTWEVAGTAHADRYLVGPIASLLGCDFAVNDGPHHFVAHAALRALDDWVAGGTPPGTALPLQLRSTRPPVVARDGLGNALGGVRTPDVDVPVASLRGEAPEGVSVLCSLFGSTVRFDGATLRRLYGDEPSYVAAYAASLRDAIAAGFLLADDQEEMLAKAAGVSFAP